MAESYLWIEHLYNETKRTNNDWVAWDKISFDTAWDGAWAYITQISLRTKTRSRFDVIRIKPCASSRWTIFDARKSWTEDAPSRIL